MMSQANKEVKLKLEIKGSPKFKFEYKGRLGDALDLCSDALAAVKRRVLLDVEQ